MDDPSLIEQLVVALVPLVVGLVLGYVIHVLQERARRAEADRTRYHLDRVRAYSEFLAAAVAADHSTQDLERAYMAALLVGTRHVQDAATHLYSGVSAVHQRDDMAPKEILDAILQAVAAFVEETQIELGVVGEVGEGVRKYREQMRPWWEYWNLRRDEQGRILRRITVTREIRSSVEAAPDGARGGDAAPPAQPEG